MACEALLGALQDGGVRPDEVDGLVTSRVPAYPRLCELVAINPNFVLPLPAHGRMSGIGIAAAAAAIADGRADVVALACGNDVYGRAGIGPVDVHVAQIYDNFTPTVLFTLEGFGFCGPGGAARLSRTAPLRSTVRSRRTTAAAICRRATCRDGH